ncbi:S8 family serine peptidase [Actinokineospora auranticolor]|uniref:Subtilisin family serine protease n=1 Tax=Actinokineospora auranticolor TaxID=155976 RepID=A0A2S6GJH4_9PSEU|nr:S8 family peptidase [Actinokineospora auranticolor]PPK65367.1 subtilisin family serine protease [Actinokineospora auranticolor]
MSSRTRRLGKRVAVAAAAVAVVSSGIGGAGPVSAAPPAPTKIGVVQYAGTAAAVPDSYIVVLADDNASADVVKRRATEITQKYGVTVTASYYTALRGFAVKGSEDAAKRIATDTAYKLIAQDQEVTTQALAVQVGPPSWGLNRIDQRSLPLDTKYHYPNTAPSIYAYIIDTGIRYTHQEFGGRAIYGIDTIGGTFPPGNDCNGHGTHVAGTVGGTTTGVAKQVQLVSVRVLDCAGAGTYAGVIAGVDWVTNDTILNGRKAVANMSLGGGTFAPLNMAVTNSVAANVHYSVAAGNSNANACSFSPASTPAATTVGSTDPNDARSSFSNWGPCVDLFAPGRNIVSAWATADNAYQTLSGTSMASPHVAGTAALWRQRFPGDTAWQTATALAGNATPGVVVGPGAGSPNLLLFMGMVPA